MASPSSLLLLAASVLATFVACKPIGESPDWQEADTTKPKRAHLEPGGTADVELDFEASGEIDIAVSVQNVSVQDTTLRIDMQDSRAVCNGADSFIRTHGSWRSSERPDEQIPPVLRFEPSCFSSAREGSMTIRFTNEGTTAFDFEWFATGTTGGSNDAPKPESPFVRLTVR